VAFRLFDQHGVSIAPFGDKRAEAVKRLIGSLCDGTSAESGPGYDVQIIESPTLLGLVSFSEAFALTHNLVIARAGDDGIAQARAALLIDLKHDKEQACALAELLSRAALLTLRAAAQEHQLSFWRARATAALEDLRRLRVVALKEKRLREKIARATSEIARLARIKRFSALGALAAQLGGFDAWLVAVRTSEGLVVKANATGQKLNGVPSSSALVASYEQRAVIARLNPTSSSALAPITYAEDRMVREGKFACYAVFPFASGALMLLSSRPHGNFDCEAVQACVEAVAPIVRSWLLEEELERYRTVVADLSRRLLREADAERARIARDLHDDQAQLLAALKIVLKAPKSKAARLVEELEKDLRRKISTLRPKTLEGLSLEQAIRAELARIEAAGVKTRLRWEIKERAVAKDVRELCYHATREGVANALRHAAPSWVEIGIKRVQGHLELKIRSDVSRSLPKSIARKGSGLKGLQERLNLFGGNCQLEIGSGESTLRVKIPLINK